MQIHYLEIVTMEVDAVCAVYAAANGVQFGKPDAGFGNARTAAMPGGGLVGVRAPMRDTEEPVVRPYWLVDDIKAALDDAGLIESNVVTVTGRFVAENCVNAEVYDGAAYRARLA